jgi:hypothetical protein
MRRHGDSRILHVRPADAGDDAREVFAQLLAVVRSPLGGRAQLLSQVLIHRPPQVSAEEAAALLGQAPPQLCPVRAGLAGLGLGLGRRSSGGAPGMLLGRSSAGGQQQLQRQQQQQQEGGADGPAQPQPQPPPQQQQQPGGAGGGGGAEGQEGPGLCRSPGAGGCSLERPVASCVVCLDAPPLMGLKHGGTVHRCTCYACAVALVHKGDGLCPLCRQRIEEVLLVY